MTALHLVGCGTALVTPFNADRSVDESALRALVDWQIEEGIHFLVPCGSTGEAATMTAAEHQRVVAVVVEQTRDRVPVVAGAASNDTTKAIALSKLMRDAGATHLLHTSPMYNKPPQRGIVAHFSAIADAVQLPIIAYNVPSRTGSNVEASTMLEIAKIRGIVGVKEASGQLSQIADIIHRRPPVFSVLSGDDELTLPVMALGGDGVISVVANAAPRLMAQLCDKMRAEDICAARELHFKLLPLMRAAFVESNPLPVKAAMAMLGRIQNVLRLPLVPMSDSHNSTVRTALSSVGALA